MDHRICIFGFESPVEITHHRTGGVLSRSALSTHAALEWCHPSAWGCVEAVGLGFAAVLSASKMVSCCISPSIVLMKYDGDEVFGGNELPFHLFILGPSSWRF